jgi:hypothetical protein
MVTFSQPNNHTNYYLHPLIQAWLGLHELMNQALPSQGTKHMVYESREKKKNKEACLAWKGREKMVLPL